MTEVVRLHWWQLGSLAYKTVTVTDSRTAQRFGTTVVYGLGRQGRARAPARDYACVMRDVDLCNVRVLLLAGTRALRRHERAVRAHRAKITPLTATPTR